MPGSDVKDYPLVVGDEFLARLRRSTDSAPANGAEGRELPNFAIRYTVPPEPLKKQNNDLRLRKTTRGEYIVEDASAMAAPAQGTEQDEGSQAGNGSTAKASFRGPGNVAYDAECVLIFNKELRKYELHFLEMNIQVSPVLKGRLRNTGGQTSQPSSAGSATVSNHNEASRDRSVQDLRPQSRKPLAKSAAGSVSKASSPVGSPMKRPTNSQPSNPGSTKAHSSTGAAAALIPKRSSKAKLPTRRKLAPAKIKLGPFPAESAPSQHSEQLVANKDSGDAPPSSERKGVSTKPPSSNVSLTSVPSPKKTAASLPPQARPNPSAQSQSLDSGFDDAFDDLADELADELMEDDTETKHSETRLVGTAGGSAEDEDISSEEE